MMKKKFRILVFGEVLFDIYPHKQAQYIGGAPFNFLFHLHKFNHNVDFISKIGNDEMGQTILDIITKFGISKKLIQIDDKYETGKVIINLDNNKVPEYDIKKNVAYDYIDTPEITDITKYDMLYFGTLAQRNKKSRDTIINILKKSDNVLKFYDINLRQNYYTKNIVFDSLKMTDILKLNKDELNTVCNLFDLKEKNEICNLKILSQKFNIKYICVTYGADGSTLFSNNKISRFSMKKQNDIVDTVGAGDAFSAMLSLGILNNNDSSSILKTASDYALKICRKTGAIEY